MRTLAPKAKLTKKLTAAAVGSVLALGLTACGDNYNEAAVGRAGFSNPHSLPNTQDLVIADFGICAITLRFNQGVFIQNPSDENEFIEVDNIRLAYMVNTDPEWSTFKVCLEEVDEKQSS